MNNPVDAMGRCVVCGKKCESTGGCDCTTINAYGAGSPTTALAPDAQALIAAKDAELQKANYLLSRREKLIKKLGKKLQSAESKCAKMRDLLGECAELCHGNEERRALVAKIDAILESEE